MTEDNSPEDWQVILAQVYRTEPKSWIPVLEMLIESEAEDTVFPLEVEGDSVVLPKDGLVVVVAHTLELLLDFRCEHGS